MEKELKTEMDSVIALARDYESQRCAIASLLMAITRRNLNNNMLTGNCLVDSCFMELDKLFSEMDTLKKELSKYKEPTPEPKMPEPEPKSPDLHTDFREIFDNSGNLLGRILHASW